MNGKDQNPGIGWTVQKQRPQYFSLGLWIGISVVIAPLMLRISPVMGKLYYSGDLRPVLNRGDATQILAQPFSLLDISVFWGKPILLNQGQSWIKFFEALTSWAFGPEWGQVTVLHAVFSWAFFSMAFLLWTYGMPRIFIFTGAGLFAFGAPMFTLTTMGWHYATFSLALFPLCLGLARKTYVGKTWTVPMLLGAALGVGLFSSTLAPVFFTVVAGQLIFSYWLSRQDATELRAPHLPWRGVVALILPLILNAWWILPRLFLRFQESSLTSNLGLSENSIATASWIDWLTPLTGFGMTYNNSWESIASDMAKYSLLAYLSLGLALFLTAVLQGRLDRFEYAWPVASLLAIIGLALVNQQEVIRILGGLGLGRDTGRLLSLGYPLIILLACAGLKYAQEDRQMLTRSVVRFGGLALSIGAVSPFLSPGIAPKQPFPQPALQLAPLPTIPTAEFQRQMTRLDPRSAAVGLPADYLLFWPSSSFFQPLFHSASNPLSQIDKVITLNSSEKGQGEQKFASHVLAAFDSLDAYDQERVLRYLGAAASVRLLNAQSGMELEQDGPRDSTSLNQYQVEPRDLSVATVRLSRVDRSEIQLPAELNMTSLKGGKTIAKFENRDWEGAWSLQASTLATPGTYVKYTIGGVESTAAVSSQSTLPFIFKGEDVGWALSVPLDDLSEGGDVEIVVGNVYSDIQYHLAVVSGIAMVVTIVMLFVMRKFTAPSARGEKEESW